MGRIQVAGSCEDGNKLAGSLKDEEFRDRDCKLLKGSALRVCCAVRYVSMILAPCAVLALPCGFRLSDQPSECTDGCVTETTRHEQRPPHRKMVIRNYRSPPSPDLAYQVASSSVYAGGLYLGGVGLGS
jgi:hypothetical protein